MVDYAVVPERLALLNVDLQEVFVEGTPIAAIDGLAVVERVNRLAAVCRAAGILVVHTAHVTRPDGSNVGVLGEIFPPVRDGMIARGSKGAALHRALRVEASDLILEKPRYGAFHATDLELILHQRGIDTVIVTGIATNVCVDTTAREAVVRDFRVFFASDGTGTNVMGGVAADDLARATLATMAFGFAKVVTVDEMIKSIGEARAATGRRT
jgi:ureidoacrylate peracid hydrolase